ncbi:MAG: hypothetical protein WCG34_05290 [Leptolinea sp.]
MASSKRWTAKPIKTLLDLLLQYFAAVKRQFGDNSQYQVADEWTPERLANYAQFLVAKNDVSLLLDAVQSEKQGYRRRLLDLVGRLELDTPNNNATRVYKAMEATSELDSGIVQCKTKCIPHTRGGEPDMKPVEAKLSELFTRAPTPEI